MRVSRKRVEGCGALASNLQKREVNFSRMLCYIFVRWLDIRVSHFYTFFELSLVLLTTQAHGL